MQQCVSCRRFGGVEGELAASLVLTHTHTHTHTSRTVGAYLHTQIFLAQTLAYTHTRTHTHTHSHRQLPGKGGVLTDESAAEVAVSES